MRKFTRLLAAAVITASASFQAMAEDLGIVRLATTTSTYNSGLLDYLLPDFEKEHGATIQVIAVGTGKALRMGRDGDVDVVMTHAPKAEEKFVNEGYGVNPRGLMYNDFVLVGPKSDPAGVKGSQDISQALGKVSANNALFVSRGDDSGTHKKELNLWKQTGVKLPFDGYREVGQGMGKVLQISSELQGYTLTDRGTWLAYKTKVDLEIVSEGDARLFNPYQVIIVNPKRHQDLNTKGAETLSKWLVSDKTQDKINNFRLHGEQLFVANAKD
ncbi:substrate-binding domain-containing protein [Oceanospirillum beijerinckii]|uniref:substrate-binding domain-containing protein n=1 Tax=Oceanospirillum beijerinckii TaxID=64976 RepID=UPI0003FD5E92|nr:substrate-binding domain-containing protein [Oceanospirillum beijerinckii]